MEFLSCPLFLKVVRNDEIYKQDDRFNHRFNDSGFGCLLYLLPDDEIDYGDTENETATVVYPYRALNPDEVSSPILFNKPKFDSNFNP